VLWTMTVVYVASAIVTTVILLEATRPLMEADRPATHRLGLAMAAGLAWPVMLLGLVEFSGLIALSKAHAPAMAKPASPSWPDCRK
jgi:hypothetical protein